MPLLYQKYAEYTKFFIQYFTYDREKSVELAECMFDSQGSYCYDKWQYHEELARIASQDI